MRNKKTEKSYEDILLSIEIDILLNNKKRKDSIAG